MIALTSAGSAMVGDADILAFCWSGVGYGVGSGRAVVQLHSRGRARVCGGRMYRCADEADKDEVEYVGRLVNEQMSESVE